MNPKPYIKEKRAFLLNKSKDELWAFFNEISNPEKQRLIEGAFPFSRLV